MKKEKKLIIFGIGEIGQLAKFYFQEDSEYEVVAFTADDEFVNANEFDGLPLIKFSEIKSYYPPEKYFMHVALSYNRLNQIRSEKYNLAKSLGYTLPSYICSKSVSWSDLQTGDNCFILENQTIQPNVIIGSNVMIWSGNHLGHGSRIGDHTYISSHVCISGHTQIGTHCFFGVNSATKDFIHVGDSVFVTMGALVTSNIESGAVVVGSKGVTYQKDSRESVALKRKYFNLA